MKILLTAINSKYIHSNLAVYSLKAYYDEHCNTSGDLSAGIMSNTVKKDVLQHVVKSGDSPVEIAEYTINQYTDDIIRSIYVKKPDVIAFSCYIWNIEYVYEVARELKKLLPNTDVWLGGPEVTYDAESVLSEHVYIKGIMIGEGEETFLEVCRHYVENQKDFCDVAGISVRIDEINGIDPMNSTKHSQEMYFGQNMSGRNKLMHIYTSKVRPLLDMDTLPFVYKDMSFFENKIIYYESSRGCPFGCSYCLSSVEKSVRFRSLDLVFDELQYFLDIRVAQVKFVDRTFNCNHDRTLQLLSFIYEHDNGITNFHFEVAADLLKADEIAIINRMRPGLVQLEIGVQSVNPDTIEAIDRTMNLNELSGVVNQVNSVHNIHQHLDLIAGLPYEDLESFKHSFDYVYRLRPEQLQLGFLKVLKGSKMHRMADQYGIVYKDKPPYEVMKTNWISYDDVLYLKNIEEMVELYYNSRQYVNTINYWEKQFASPFALYDCLAAYYSKHDLYEVKHSRMTRYNILLQCIYENSSEPEIYSQILLFDLFLRENLKTRPAFASDVSDLKSIIRAMYIAVDAPKSAHIEPFSIDITKYAKMLSDTYVIHADGVQGEWNNLLARTACDLKDMCFILFDYDNRDALNHNARIVKIIVE